MGMQITQGRDFVGLADSNRVIFNGGGHRPLTYRKTRSTKPSAGEARARQIAGVVKDALMVSPFAAADPTMFVIAPSVQHHLLYRLAPACEYQPLPLAQLTADIQ